MSVSYTTQSVEQWLNYDCLVPLAHLLKSSFVSAGLHHVHSIYAKSRLPQPEINQFLSDLPLEGGHPTPWIYQAVLREALHHARRGTSSRPRIVTEPFYLGLEREPPYDLLEFLEYYAVIPLQHIKESLVSLGIDDEHSIVALSGLPAPVLDAIIPHLEDADTHSTIHYKDAGALRIALDSMLSSKPYSEHEWKQKRSNDVKRLREKVLGK